MDDEQIRARETIAGCFVERSDDATGDAMLRGMMEELYAAGATQVDIKWRGRIINRFTDDPNSR